MEDDCGNDINDVIELLQASATGVLDLFSSKEINHTSGVMSFVMYVCNCMSIICRLVILFVKLLNFIPFQHDSRSLSLGQKSCTRLIRLNRTLPFDVSHREFFVCVCFFAYIRISETIMMMIMETVMRSAVAVVVTCMSFANAYVYKLYMFAVNARHHR